MTQKLTEIENRYKVLEGLLSDHQVINDQEKYQKYAKEHAGLVPLISSFRHHQELTKEIDENNSLLRDEDADIRDMAKEELHQLQSRLTGIEQNLMALLLPKDPNDDKNIILEIRAGTGGDEAGLFAGDLFRMYSRFAEIRRFKIEVLSSNPTGVGGFKEVVALIAGNGAYSLFKYESGTHRVQRVPVTESQGRIHTSAVTVAILPEAEDVDVDIKPEEIRVDVFRSSGPGGQSVNTTDSAVRVTHIPTGLVVTCQDEKSQHKNKAKAIKILRARLLDLMNKEQQDKISSDRKTQVGSGDRSERIRTYNFPQSRVTDHRIGLTLYKLESILAGELEELIHPLITHFQAEMLKQEH
ncbi:MAG: peptide chain release factor 1 [Deltaproteobacteria bacterium]|nr:peptide chain release factor 1 [Deltaproteobacteria bacterium]MBF0524426.1 peptide chain release factor 1 [Deltaproteobacteria bacterium]